MEGDNVVDDPGGSENNCFKCKILFEDLKTIVQCTGCKNFYHGKCENIDFRGFHMKKSSWKCKMCLESSNENGNDAKIQRSRKRSRVDENYIEQDVIDKINETLDLLLKGNNELNKKVDLLIAENQNLKLEIAKLKECKTDYDVAPCKTNNTYASIAGNQPNNSKVLVIKPKGQQRDVKQIKKDLQEKVNPSDIGIGVTMGRTTKNGGLILTCGNEKEILTVQTEIQGKLGDEYEVDRPKTHEHRIKVVGINECEHGIGDGDIIHKVIRQNDLEINNKDLKLKILRKTNIVNKRFNLIFETDSSTYNLFMNKQKMNIGWNRCWVFNDYGIIRCYNCNKYGHLQKDCKDKKTCPRCGEEHEMKDCSGDSLKCINCKVSNEKYGMNLNTEHTAWDVTKCETYKRIETIQKNKFTQ